MQITIWVVAILISVVGGYLVLNSDKKRNVPIPFLTSGLRSIAIFFTLLLLIAPEISNTINTFEKPIIVLLQDNSTSIGYSLKGDSILYRTKIEDLKAKLSANYKVIQKGFGNYLQSDSFYKYHQSVTDISSALSEIQESYGMQNLGAVVLATDGCYNEGLNPLFAPLSFQCSIFAIGLGDSTLKKDVRIAQVRANKTVILDNNFEINFDIIANHCAGYNNYVSLKEEGKVISSLPLKISDDKFDKTQSFTLKADKPGLHHYSIVVPVAEGEENKLNNNRDVFVEVIEDKKNILIVSAAPHPDINAIKEAISGIETYKVSVCDAENFTGSLSKYDAIILHGLPSLKYNFTSALLAAKKPLWLILTNQSSYQIVNDMHYLTHGSVASSNLTNFRANFNPAFNAFTLPSKIQEVLDKMPPLSANVTNLACPPGAFVLMQQKTGFATGPSPVWSLSQSDIPSAYLMGEGIWKWRMYEYKQYGNHDVIDECIRQTVGFLCTGNNDKPFTVKMKKAIWSDEEPITLNAYLLNSNNEPINAPEAEVSLMDSSGKKVKYTFERKGTSYAVNVGIRPAGNYKYNAQTSYNGKSYNTAGSFAVQSIPLELMVTESDFSLLYSLSRKFDGNFFTLNQIPFVFDAITKNKNVKKVIHSSIERKPIIEKKWLFFIILAVVTAEWLLRKYWLAQ